MSTVNRNLKVGGNLSFENEYQAGFTFLRASEVDADLDVLYNAWNTQIPNAVEELVLPTALPPSGPAGGDLAGSYPDPTIKAGIIPVALPPSGPAGGSLAGTYPNPTIAPTGVTPGVAGSPIVIPVLNILADGRISSVVPTNVAFPAASNTLQEFNDIFDTTITTTGDWAMPAMLATGGLQVGRGYHFKVMGIATRPSSFIVNVRTMIGGAHAGITPSTTAVTGTVAWDLDVYFYIVDATTIWVNSRNRMSGTNAPSGPPSAVPTPTENICQGTTTPTDLNLGIQVIAAISSFTSNPGNRVRRLRSVVYAA